MGRHGESKKFSFPIPRRLKSKVDDGDDDDNNSNNHTDDSNRPTSSRRSNRRPPPEWSARPDNSSTSKAHRVLGTSDPIHRTTSNQNHSSVPPSPGLMSITVSEASYGSHADDRSVGAVEHGGYSRRHDMSRKASSNVLGRVYSRDGRRSSDNSSVSRLHQQTSNSTLRSHYDAKNSPLAISQQTSDSAVRDRALRRGHPQVVTEDYECHASGPLSPRHIIEAKKDTRKGKPARLDLSKLFPRPKMGHLSNHGNALLSPAKMVSSPAALSSTSEYFPRPMTREPTPQVGGKAKLSKLETGTSHQAPTQSPRPSSPIRKFKRDQFDNAKIHVRRPPKGVQHWFDALDEDSDEALEKPKTHIYAPRAVRPNGIQIPPRKASNGKLYNDDLRSQPSSHKYLHPGARNDTFSHEDLVDASRLTSPSQFSVNSLQSTKTKESALSKSNLQDSSVLSFSSSSEDENDNGQSRRRYTVRKSLDMADDSGEIVIGQAQAYEVRQNRRPSAGMMSTRSNSTSAATIEVMYTPEPPFTPYRGSTYSSSRRSSQRSSHFRQPSVIHEDEDNRPQTAINMPLSPTSYSVRSGRTSMSEPQPRTNGSHKMMAVTAEEEALLDMMRKKRAAMAKMGAFDEEPSAADHEKALKTPVENTEQKYRTSGFLSEASPVRVVETKSPRRQSTSTSPSSPHLQPPVPRGRFLHTVHETNAGLGASQFRDSAASDNWSDQHTSTASQTIVPHYLPTPAEFSPLELFHPSSPTTTDHASPLPSPITPGLRNGETDVAVKVANSDTSNDLEDLPVLDTGIIGAIHAKAPNATSTRDLTQSHQRRRTASSGAEVPITFPRPPTIITKDLGPLSEASSPALSIADMTITTKSASKASRRASALSVTTSRQGSIRSTSSRSSSYSQNPSVRSAPAFEKRSSRLGSVKTGASTRSSISDDVLAAWNSLGGTY